MPFLSKEHLAGMLEALAAKDARIAELTDTLIAMKRQGYVPKEPDPVPVKMKPLSAVDVALRELPPRVRGQVAGAAAMWISQGMTETDAAIRIQQGEEHWLATHEEART